MLGNSEFCISPASILKPNGCIIRVTVETALFAVLAIEGKLGGALLDLQISRAARMWSAKSPGGSQRL
jgi:hypothetical protein